MHSGINQHTSPPEKIPEATQGDSREKAAEMVGTNPHYVSDAKKINEAKARMSAGGEGRQKIAYLAKGKASDKAAEMVGAGAR